MIGALLQIIADVYGYAALAILIWVVVWAVIWSISKQAAKIHVSRHLLPNVSFLIGGLRDQVKAITKGPRMASGDYDIVVRQVDGKLAAIIGFLDAFIEGRIRAGLIARRDEMALQLLSKTTREHMISDMVEETALLESHYYRLAERASDRAIRESGALYARAGLTPSGGKDVDIVNDRRRAGTH